MIDYKYADLYTKDSVSKQLLMKADDGLVEITNVDLHYEQFELEESLCSESELRFGCCEASSLKFRLSDIFTPLKDKWLTVTETLDKNTDVSFQFGRYKVFSDKPTADRRYRNIVAYDAMYDIINTDVADWYNEILPNLDSMVTMKEFRTSFIAHFGLEQEEVELVNDSMIIEKTIQPSEISGKDVITAICELNGCFGHIGRDGKFKYVFLTKKSEELYPTEDLYPAEDLFIPASNAIEIKKSTYISCHYEDFVTSNITKLQVRQEENDIGAIVGKDGNCYIVEDNFLVYGKSTEELAQIATNLLSVITDVVYRPFDASVKGNPCLEVGDKVRLKTKYEIIESYILKRTLKGIQALRDTFEADGAEYYTEKVNAVQRSIIQLKGKTNVLERDVERTKSSITNLETKLENDYLTEIETKSVIEQSATEINLKVSKKVGNDEIISKINQTAESIKISAERIDVDGVLDAEKIEALEIKSKHVEVVNEEGKQTGKWNADGFMAQTDSYATTEYFPKYFENNFYNYPYYHEENSIGMPTGDYVASYIIELEDVASEHTVYVKFKNPNRNTYNTEEVVFYDDSIIYEYVSKDGKIILTVANWFGSYTIRGYMEELYDTISIKSMWFNDVEKIWSPTTGIKRVSASTGGDGSGAINAVKYSYDNEAVKMSVSGMEINTEEGTIKSDHYIIDDDGVNFQLNTYVGADTLEGSRVNRLKMNKDGLCMTAIEFDGNNNMSEYKYMELITSLYEAGIQFRSPHIDGSPECYFGVAGMENTAVYKTTTSGGSVVRIDSAGKFYRYVSSSRRYKKDITTEINAALNPEKLYELEVVQYKYDDGYLEKDDQRYGKDFIGFIAEQVAEIYPLACNMDEQNRPEMWEIGILFPPLLKLVQDQKKQIDRLEERLAKLEERLGVADE